MALKLDMSKAYDTIEWSYLEKVLLKLGFPKKWMTLILACVSSVSFAFLINGEPKGHLYPSKGLRQRDLLSPYLLCTDGLSTLIAKEEWEN
ncbi:hypothetical protein TB2_034445 [Malus domestica]